MEKTIATYLADLRLDLKDSGSLWSDTELTRCVERAVADYSRFNPDQKSLELAIDAEVASDSVTMPAVSDPNMYVAGMDISASVAGATCTLTTTLKPTVPRPVMITVTDAGAGGAITAFVIIVKGYDVDSKYIEETFYLEGGLVQTGDRYIALISEVEIDSISGNSAGDKLDVGTGSHLEVFVPLDYKPIKFQSETITGYVLETDYLMDYAGGRIAMKTGGTMVAATAYTIAYTRSRIDVDLSSIIPDLIRVERVEYPEGNIPQQFSKMEVWGKILTLAGGMESQAEATDAEHLIIKYLAKHSPPNTRSSGSYPSFLDCTVELAASAYALFIMALKYEHQAVTDLESSRTALWGLTAPHALAETALAKIITYLTDNSNEDSKYWLTKITTDIAELRTAIGNGAAGALGKGYTLLDKVATASIDKLVTGAEALLDTGDDYIDAINQGASVPENYRDYSMARANIANMRQAVVSAYIQEAATRLANLSSYIAQAGAWGEIARGFAEEANGHLGDMDRYLQEAMTYLQTAGSSQSLADRFRAEAIERRNEAWAIWSSPNQIAPNYALGQRSQLTS